MAETIVTAETADHYDAFAKLVRECVDWCRARYSHDKWFVDAAFSHQSLDTELEALSRSYGPPNGRTLLALRDRLSVRNWLLPGGIWHMREICELRPEADVHRAHDQIRWLGPAGELANEHGRVACAVNVINEDDKPAIRRYDLWNPSHLFRSKGRVEVFEGLAQHVVKRQ